MSNVLSQRRAALSCRASVLRAAILALCHQAALAQAEPASPLEAVTVSASRSDTRLQEMPLHTSVITQDEIRQSPARTLDQLLRQVGGLQVSGAPAFTTDPTGHNIKFRGMDKKVLVLVDGIPVLDPFYTTIQWFKVPLTAIERVEIVRGGGSSLWGNLAVGGVINIVSKRPVGNEGEASITGGSFNTWTASLSKQIVVSDVLSLSLSADAFTSDGYNNAPADLRSAYWPGRGTSSATSHNVRLGAHFKPSADLKGFVRVGYHEQDEQIGGYTYGHNVQQSPDLQAGLTKSFDKASRLVANVYAQRVDFDKYNGAACYAGATYACGVPTTTAATTAQQAAAVLQYASSHDVNTYREQGGSVVYTRNQAGLLAEWQVGLDYRQIAGEDAQQSYRTPTAALPGVLRVQRANEGAGAQSFTGLFSQFKLRPIDALDITLATRVDHFRSFDGRATQTTYSNVASPVASPATGGDVPGLSKTAFDPSLSVRYEASAQLAWRGAVYKAFRAPGLNNMYRSFGSGALTIANPLLQPETLVGKEVGLDWTGQGYAMGVTLFQADVKDVVATYLLTAASPVPTTVQSICGAGYVGGTANAACPASVSFYTNGQDQRARGIELDGKWAITPTLDLSAYGTFTHTYYTRTTTGDPINTQLQQVPRYLAGGSLSWQTTAQWRNQLDARYSSEVGVSSLSSAVKLRQGDYTVFNLSSSYRVNAQVEVFASVVNLFDKRYTDGNANNVQSISYALPRAATLGLRTRF